MTMGRPRCPKGGRRLSATTKRAGLSRSESPVAKRTRLQEQQAKIFEEQMQASDMKAGDMVLKQQQQRQLLSLPAEVVMMILEFCQPYHEVARLRTVCRAFDETCCRIIKAGFHKMQEHVNHSVTRLEREVAALLEPVTYDGPPLSCTARRTLQRNLQRQQHLRLLGFQLQLVRSLTWRYVEADACTPPYARLLDTCAALVYGGERGEPRPRMHVHTCRNVAMSLLKNFLRHVEERHQAKAIGGLMPFSRSPPRGKGRERAYTLADIVLPCACVIDLLEASLASPHDTRHCRLTSRQTRSHSVRVETRYDLEGCWLGVYSGSNPHGALHAADIHLLTSILCDLVCSSCEGRLLGLQAELDRAEAERAEADRQKELPGVGRGRPPFCVYPRLHNPRQCYRGSIREPTGRVFAFGHAPGDRNGLRVFLDLTANVALVPASLKRRVAGYDPFLTSASASASGSPPSTPPSSPGIGALHISASEPFISKDLIAAHSWDAPARSMPFQMKLVFESNAERVVYRSYAS